MLRHQITMFGLFGFVLAASLFSGGQAQARDTELLNQAVNDSSQEKAGVEAEFKTNRAARAEGQTQGGSHSIALVLGDELGGTHAAPDRLKVHSQPRSYSEQAVAVKLDKEWKEVNKSVKRASHEVKDQPTKTVSQKPIAEDDEF